METLILVGFLLLLLLFWQRKPSKFPPGPPRLPFIGSLPFLLGYKSQFWRIKSLYEKYGPIYGFYTGSRPVVVLSDLDLIKTVFGLSEVSDRPAVPAQSIIRNGRSDGEGTTGILFSSGETWKEQRRFSLRNLRDLGFGKTTMEDTISTEAVKLTHLLRKVAGQPTSLDAKFNISILNALWIILVGEKMELDDPKLKSIIKSVGNIVKATASISTNNPLTLTFPFLTKLFPNYYFRDSLIFKKNLELVLNPQRQLHRDTIDDSNPRDYLDVHILAQCDAKPGSSFYGDAGQKNEVSNMIDLFLAGTETTSTTLEWAILIMLHHPEVAEKMQEELDRVVGRDRIPTLQDEPNLPYTGAVIMEIHRVASVVYLGVPHKAKEDVVVGEYVIPKGCTVIGNILQVMHNPQVFEDPEAFKPERFMMEDGSVNTQHPHVIPFLVGKRYCLGMSLAMKELFLFLTIIMQTFHFRAVPGQHLAEYRTFSRNVPTPNGIIRFCPPYNVIIEERRL